MAGEQESGNGFKTDVAEKVGYFKRLSENFDTFMADQKKDHEGIRREISKVNERLNKASLKVAGLSGTVALIVTIVALLIAAHLKG